MLDLGTAVAYINLDLTAFNTGIETVVSSLNGLETTLATQSFAWSDFFISAGKMATNLGESMTKSFTAPLVALGTSAIDSFIDYESAFTGVKKTLDIGNRSAEEAAVLYQELSDAIEEMSTRTASSASEIAGVAEIAGQLGIGAEDLIKFTEVMVMLGDTTNLTSATAAESLAKFINVTGTSKDDIDKLGASVVDLGNHFATNESDIVLMSTRLASAGTIAGLTERDILALSTAMSSVGIRAEAGGSAMSQTLAQIEKAVQMSIAGDDGAIETLNTLAMVSGMSAEEFSSAWMADPMKALTSFLYGLGQLDEQGESTVLILDQLGMTGIRQSNMLKALGLASEVLSDAVAISNEAWEENTALMNEANLRYGTTESQLKQLGQEWEILKRELAEMLLPVMWELVDLLKSLMEWWRGLSDETKESIVHFLEFVAVVGPILTIVGKLSTGFGLLLKVFDGIRVVGSFVIGFFQGLTGHVAGFDGAVVKAGGGLKTFQGIFQTLWNVLKQGFTLFISAVQKIVGFIGQIGSAFIQHILPIMKTLGGVTSLIGGIVTAIVSFFDMWNNGFSMAKEAVMLLGIALAAVGAVILGAPAAIAGVVAAIVGLVATAAIAIKDHWEDIKQWFIDGIKAIGDWFSNIWEQSTRFLGEVADAIGKFISDAWKVVTDFFEDLFDGVGDFFSDVFGAASDFFSRIFSRLGKFFEEVFGKASEFFGNLFSNIGDFFSNVFQKAQGFFEDLVQNVANFFSNIFGRAADFFSNMFGSLGSFLSDLWQNISGFFSTVFDRVGSFLTQIWGEVANFFSNVFGTIGDFFGNLFKNVGGWLSGLRMDIANWFNNLLVWIGSLPSYFFNAGKNLLSSFWDGLKSIWGSIAGWFSDNFGWLGDIVSNVVSFVSGKGWNGSHANGLDYVPFNGYVAQLHQGERVLTKAEAKEYDKDENRRDGDTFNFYNTKPDPYEYARQMKRAKREMAF